MCQFLYSEGAAWKRSWQLCFPWMPEAGVKRQQGASMRRWGAVSPLRCPRKSPCGSWYLHTAQSYGSRRLPYLPVSRKTVNNIYFSGPIWQIVLLDVVQLWSSYRLFFLHCTKKVFKSKKLMHLKEERTGQHDLLQTFASSTLNQFSFFPPLLFLNSPLVELKKPQNPSVALALPSCCLAQGPWDAVSSRALFRSLSPGCALQCSH